MGYKDKDSFMEINLVKMIPFNIFPSSASQKKENYLKGIKKICGALQRLFEMLVEVLRKLRSCPGNAVPKKRKEN